MKTQLPALKEAHTLLAQAPSPSITTQQQVTDATEFLSRSNNTLKLLTTVEDELTQPLKEQLDTIKEPFTAPKKQLKDVILSVRTALSNYQTEQLKLAQADAKRIAERAAKGTLRPETAIRKLDEIDTPQAKTVTTSGSLSFRATPTLKITDQSLIPHQYMLPNEKLILETLKAGTQVPGCAIEIVQVPVNRRA